MDSHREHLSQGPQQFHESPVLHTVAFFLFCGAAMTKRKEDASDSDEQQHQHSGSDSDHAPVLRSQPADDEAEGKPKTKPGIIYMSKLPPFMKPQKMRFLLEQYGTINRLYLAPEGTASERDWHR